MNPDLSVLVSARKDSKYLAKFLLGYFQNTYDMVRTDIYVMLNQHDTWNKELVDYFTDNESITFDYENYELGRNGLHVYFNDLLKQTDSDWVVYFCEDHFITMQGWDKYVRQIIAGGPRSMEHTTNTRAPLDPKEPYCIVPKFDNVGAMNQILSRGYINAIGDMGKHGWIDSYINDLNREAGFGRLDATKYVEGDRVILMDDPIAHDFTHDIPSPMDQTPSKTAKAHLMPKYDSEIVRDLIKLDAERLRNAL